MSARKPFAFKRIKPGKRTDVGVWRPNVSPLLELCKELRRRREAESLEGWVLFEVQTQGPITYRQLVSSRSLSRLPQWGSIPAALQRLRRRGDVVYCRLHGWSVSGRRLVR